MNNKPIFIELLKPLKAVVVATALALLMGLPCNAQQPEVSVRFAQTALGALHVIEALGSSDSNTHTSTAREAISAAEALAATNEEHRISAALQQIYESKLRDNNVIAAYQRVIQAESYTDTSDTRQIRERKDYAASQLTDTLAVIQSREDRCFRQLETSLNQRSLQR
jgi:hypothetical protein